MSRIKKEVPNRRRNKQEIDPVRLALGLDASRFRRLIIVTGWTKGKPVVVSLELGAASTCKLFYINFQNMDAALIAKGS
jgi:hypothetical protein